MQELTITILENKKMTYPSNIVLVEGENLTTQVTVSAPSWEGLSIGCLITTPAGVMVDEFSADAPFKLTNTMLDRRGYIRFEFVGYKITEDSKEEVTRTSHAVELPVRSARPRLGEISPEPLPDLILQVTNAKNTALTAATTANEAAAGAAEIDAQARAAEAVRVAVENARNVFAPYNAATNYVVGNKVTYLGSSYLCILESTGNLPTNGTYWMLITSKGDKGDRGALNNRFARILGHVMSSKRPCVLTILGDSTGNDANEWYHLTMQWLRANRPAYSLRQRRWSDANQAYSTWTYRAASDIGDTGEAYFGFPGASGSYISTPYKSALDISGDIDIAVKVEALPNTSKTFVSRLGTGAGSRGWSFQMTSANYPYFYWSADGSTLIGPIPATVPYVFQSGVPIWLRVTLDADNGAGGYTLKFYTSPDAYTWTQLGADVVGAAPTSIFTNNVALELGARTSGTSGFFPGKIYEAWVKRGIDGAPVASPCAGLAFPSGATFLDVENNVWTVNGLATSGNGSPEILSLNGSVAGQVIAYSTDPTRFAKQTPLEPVLAFISYGHNEGTNVDYQTTYDVLCAQFRTKYPNVGVVCCTQNPKKTPATNIEQHTTRNAQIATLAIIKDYGLIDAYRAFKDMPNCDDYINADGIHPTTSGDANGSVLWSLAAQDFLSASI